VKTGARGGGLRELKSGIRLVRDRDNVPCPFVDILREPDSHHGSHTDRWIKAKLGRYSVPQDRARSL
jgi:hypothetical protein